jgi:hypothetical protein
VTLTFGLKLHNFRAALSVALTECLAAVRRDRAVEFSLTDEGTDQDDLPWDSLEQVAIAYGGHD